MSEEDFDRKPDPTVEEIVTMLKAIEDHPDIDKYVIEPADWPTGAADAPCTERFIYLAPSRKCDSYPPDSLMELANQFDLDILDFILDENQKPMQDRVDALQAAGYTIESPTVADDGEWLDFTVRTKHGPYYC